jgi:hypothetical protein
MTSGARAAPGALLCALALLACAKPAPGGALPSGALDSAIGAAIGDPSTCVIIAERASGRRLYQYGQDFNCARPLPACDRPGTLTGRNALALAGAPGGRDASCPSNAAGTRTVGWSEGAVASAGRDLVYSAVMEGERALPGHEMDSRLADALSQAGL